MKPGKGEAGYVLIFLLFMITVLPLIMNFSADVLKQAGGVSHTMQRDLTLMRMGILKTSVVNQAEDVDRDNYCEPLMDEAGALPLKMRLVMKDAWENDIKYCHWDLGSENAIDPAYSQNYEDLSIPSPPIGGMIARLISPGEDGNLDTGCDDVTPTGDDLVENIFNSDIRTYFR